MSSAVRFAAMIPASCAVARASPFGRSRRRFAVSGAMRTTARATARRCCTGFAPTSTIRTEPDSSTCERSLIPAPPPAKPAAPLLVSLRRAYDSLRERNALDVAEQVADPARDVVLAHVLADRARALGTLGVRHRQRRVQRLGLARHVERVDGQRPRAELFERAGVFRKDNDTVAL